MRVQQGNDNAIIFVFQGVGQLLEIGCIDEYNSVFMVEESTRKPPILIAEDNRGIANFLEMYFETKDIPTIITATPEQALNYIQEYKDMKLRLGWFDARFSGTELTGFDLARRFRGICAGTVNQYTPLVLFSAGTWKANEVEASGFNTMILKPVDIDVLDKKLEKLSVLESSWARGGQRFVNF